MHSASESTRNSNRKQYVATLEERYEYFTGTQEIFALRNTKQVVESYLFPDKRKTAPYGKAKTKCGEDSMVEGPQPTLQTESDTGESEQLNDEAESAGAHRDACSPARKRTKPDSAGRHDEQAGPSHDPQCSDGGTPGDAPQTLSELKRLVTHALSELSKCNFQHLGLFKLPTYLTVLEGSTERLLTASGTNMYNSDEAASRMKQAHSDIKIKLGRLMTALDDSVSGNATYV